MLGQVIIQTLVYFSVLYPLELLAAVLLSATASCRSFKPC